MPRPPNPAIAKDVLRGVQQHQAAREALKKALASRRVAALEIRKVASAAPRVEPKEGRS